MKKSRLFLPKHLHMTFPAISRIQLIIFPPANREKDKEDLDSMILFDIL